MRSFRNFVDDNTGRAAVAAGGDQAEARRYIEDEVLSRAAGALDEPDLSAIVRLRLGEAVRRVG